MDDTAYSQELMTKTMDELTTDLQKIYDRIELLFTLHNSLDDLDLTQGGGTPEAQTEYQQLLVHQRLMVEEIDRRHVMEMLK